MFSELGNLNLMPMRVFGTGGNWVLENLDIEFVRGSIAELEVDIGLDGIADWSMDKSGIGRLGIQYSLIIHLLRD